MKRKWLVIFVVVVCFIFAGMSFAFAVTEQDVIDLVNKTSDDISTDVQETFEKIINGEHPYKNKDDKAFYVFVYDTQVVIVAHPKKALVGRSYKGKPDVRGKKFRDEIVEGALSNTSGWVDYSYQKPGEKGIHKKKTYYKLVSGSDGNKYVVCSGMYAD